MVASGAPELVLVSGYSGIGKSSVVNELHKALVPPRGLFGSGKFDQLKRDIPYATLVQAFQSLVRSLLSKSDAELSRWRQALLEALEPNGRLMVDLIPELKLVIGEQPPVPGLEPQQAQRRFQLVLRRFIGVFARPEHPLALFIDDLQWLDSATLDLLEDLLTQPDVRHLMLIGAYRNNEVSSTHPLMRKIEAIRRNGTMVREVVLAPLASENLTQLVAHSLHCDSNEATPLAQLIHEKTAGNPFFAIQFISALAEEALLYFEHDKGRWLWNLDRIRAKGNTDNVVDLMVGKLSRLPIATQQALQLLACIGSGADVATLAIVMETSEHEAHVLLWDALRQELAVRLDSEYKFVHDRVQEAAYSLIPEQLRAEAHIRIGRLLRAHIPPDKREETIFEIVGQFKRGAALIASLDEREQLAELYLAAGRRAKASAAYASALNYLAAGAALLPEDSWERLRELTFNLELHRAECEFVIGALPDAERRLAMLSRHSANAVEQAAVACLRIDLCTTLDDSGSAVSIGLEYLRPTGFNWSPHPTETEARLEFQKIRAKLETRTIEDFASQPLMTDPVSLATVDVLTKCAAPAALVDVNLYLVLICRAVDLSLERGISDASCFAFAWLGGVVGVRFGDYDTGLRLGQLGYELVELRGLRRFQARAYYNFATIIAWMRHISLARDPLRRAFDAAIKTGDRQYAAHICYTIVTVKLMAGDPLIDVQREAEHGHEFARKMGFGLAIDVTATQLALVRTLRGLTRKFGCFDDDHFQEIRIEHRFSSNPALGRAECWYWIRKLQARFLAGDYHEALKASLSARQLLWHTTLTPDIIDYHYYAALSRAVCCGDAIPDRSASELEAVLEDYRQLQMWTPLCAENFENRAALVGAEIARTRRPRHRRDASL